MWKHKNVNEIPSKGRGGFRKSRFCEGCQSMMVKVDIEIRVTVRLPTALLCTRCNA